MFGTNCWKPINLGARPRNNVSIPSYLFSRITSTSGIHDYNMRVWKLSESWDFLETLITATYASRQTQALQFSRMISYVQ